MLYAVRQEIDSPGGELSPKVTEGWFHVQSLIIRHAMRRPEGWPPYRAVMIDALKYPTNKQ